MIASRDYKPRFTSQSQVVWYEPLGVDPDQDSFSGEVVEMALRLFISALGKTRGTVWPIGHGSAGMRGNRLVTSMTTDLSVGKPMTAGKSEACFGKNQFLIWCSFEHLLRSKVNGSLLPLLPESLNDANRCDSSCGESGASVLERPRGGPTLDGT